VKRELQSTIYINCSPREIINALTDSQRIKQWWGVADCYISDKDGAPYLLKWNADAESNYLVWTAIIRLSNKRNLLELENVFMISPGMGIKGPYVILFESSRENDKSSLTVTQKGFTKDNASEQLIEIMGEQWSVILIQLKQFLENTSPA
jgi:uncharacterized protein YndB with AHSA1/START domain